VLDILKGNKGDKQGTYQLTNIAEQMTQNERYSDWWNSDGNCNTNSTLDYSMIDHILVSSRVKQSVNKIFAYHNYEEYCGKWNSDHYPIIIDLVFN
jgi:exonuclease III